MDLRRYFTSSRVTKDKVTELPKNVKKSQNSNQKRKRKLIIESDSDEDTVKHPAEQKNSKKIQASQNILDSSPKFSPIKKRKQDDKTTSGFLKTATAFDIFGREPVKRTFSKQLETVEKLKDTYNIPKKKLNIIDNDADFEAALEQLDAVGDDWIDQKQISPKKDQSSACIVSEKEPEKQNPIKHAENKNFVTRKVSKSADIDNYSLWVEKFKPKSSDKIIGQQGDKGNVKKLTNWLLQWSKNNVKTKKAVFVPNGWNKDPTGACFKAALLSGPPGVGKTTTVSLVCKELGFDIVEFNASDTRSKKLLQEEVASLLHNTSLTPYFSNEEKKHVVSTKRVLVMDEVDGMAGNEDRGGIQELIQLIKNTKVPIICMCNDRNHPKIRTLVNYCFDLRFSRPNVQQIKGYMSSVLYKEKLDKRISSDTLTDIIISTNHDIRLILNHLSMLAANENDNLQCSSKYVKLGPWEVLRKVFSYDDHKKMSIHEKCDLFFFDYSIAPLFVQENYLIMKPKNVTPADKRKRMELFAQAANCISIGDRIDKMIRSNNAWSLLPTQAIFASYAPGEILEGYCGGQISFPSWLGKYSKERKIDRLLQEIQIHTRLKISGSKESVNLDYAPHLYNAIIRPLKEHGSNGAESALNILHEYQILKDDVDSLQEICQWPNTVNSMTNLDSKTKAAFTRLYNKNPTVPPYSITAPIKKGISENQILYGEENNDDLEEEDDDEIDDAMIITKKKTQNKIVADTSKKDVSHSKVKSKKQSKQKK